MDRRKFLLAALVSFWTCSCDGTDRTRPNVIVICIDTLRADRVGRVAGHGSLTPNLDRLSETSVVFDQALSVSSWTKPSVPSLLTGLYPSQHGVFRTHSDSVDVLPESVTTLAEVLRSAGYRTAAFVENVHLRRGYSGLHQGFELYESDIGKASQITAGFLDWVTNREGDSAEEPFFSYLHILDPHFPYLPKDRERDRLIDEPEDLLISNWGFRTGRWRLVRDAVKQRRVRIDEVELAVLERLYDAEVQDLDATLGRLFDRLKALRLFDSTMIVVVSDHGEGFLEHEKLEHGYGLYEELLRIPLIMRFPNGEYGGRRSRERVQIIDVPATITDHVGVEFPGISGRSLVGVARGDQTSESSHAFAEEVHGQVRSTAYYEDDYKLIRTVESAHRRRRVSANVPEDLAAGARVRARGVFAGGRFITDDVKKIAEKDKDCEVQAPTRRFEHRTNPLEILDRRVQEVHGFGNAKQSPPSERLETQPGYRFARLHMANDRDIWTTQRLDTAIDGPPYEVEIEAIVDSVVTDDAYTLRLVLCGMEILVDEHTAWKQFDTPVLEDPTGRNFEFRPGFVREELYDLHRDPGERLNLASRHPDVLQRMRLGLADAEERLSTFRGPKHATVALDEATKKKLHALGYIE